MKNILFLSTIICGAVLSGCHKNNVDTGIQSNLVTNVLDSKPHRALPPAIIYKTNGDYNNYVPVNLSADRKSIVSYPAPTDLSEYSTPVTLDDGFLLDRRGISASSAFLNITYADYRKLKQAPSPDELMKMIIPDARVTEIVRLPFYSNQAMERIADINDLIKEGLPGCEVLLK